MNSELITTVWRRKWFCAAVFIAFVLGFGVLAEELPKSYSATSYLLIGLPRQANTDAFEATQVSETLTSTYAQLLETTAVSEEVRAALPRFARVDSPSADLSVGTTPSTSLISLTATEGTPAGAQALANTYAAVFIRHASAFSGAATAGARAELVERATLPTGPSAPRKSLLVLAGILIGGLVSVLGALLLDRLDSRIRIDPDAVEVMGLPIIGRVPDFPSRTARLLRTGSADDLGATETYRLLLANLKFASKRAGAKSIAVVSSAPREGKSLTAISLAAASAGLKSSTLLVDADLRRVGTSEVLRPIAGAGPDLSDVVRQAESDGADAALDETPLSSGGLAFDVLLNASPTEEAGSIIASIGFERVLAAATARYDMVVVDTPPLSAGADALRIAAISHAVVMLVDAKTARRRSVLRSVDALDRTGATVVGVVVNRVDDGGVGPYYDYTRPNNGGGRKDRVALEQGPVTREDVTEESRS